MGNKRQNWGRYNTWRPQQLVAPATLEELREAIAASKASGLKIRVAGSLHSMNDLPGSNETMIETDRLSKVLQIDREKQRVTVQSGIKLQDLLTILKREGLTLPNQGYIREQSIAGATGTATHGSSIRTGTMSSFIEEMEILDADGKLHHLTPQKDEHLFSAAVVHLGCLGAVYSMTLRCIPAKRLSLTKAKGRLGDTLKRVPEFLEKNDYFQFMIDPYSDLLVTFNYQKSEEPYHNRWLAAAKWGLIKCLSVPTFDFLPCPYWYMPLIFKIYAAVAPINNYVDDSDVSLSPADEGHYIEQEIAVPLHNLESALAASRKVLDEYSAKKMRAVALQLIRFAGPDEYGYLSPAFKRQTVYISHITVAKEGYMEIFRDVEKALYPFEGRPHWGKVHFLTKERIMQLYGHNYTLFREARQQLDPEGLFSNDYTNSLFM